MEKVKETYRFFDFSDYARPVANLIVKVLKNTRITPNQVTLLYLFAGILITQGKFLVAGILILL